MRSIKTFLLIIFALTTVNSMGQGFTLQEAVDYAMEHAYQKINANYDVESAQKKLWETIAIGLPQVKATAGYNHNPEVPVSLFPVDVLPTDQWPDGAVSGDRIPVSFAQANDANYRISVNQLIFDGSYIVGLKASKVFLTLSQQQKEKAEIDIRNNVTQAYYTALTAKQNVETFKNSLKVNERTLVETKAYYKNGFREETDKAQVELMVSNSKNSLLEVERGYKVAIAVLKFTMGMNLEENIELTDQLGSVLTGVLVSESNSADVDLTSNIDYRLAVSDVLAKKLELQNEQAQFLPKINASYSYTKTTFGDDWNLFKEDWYPSQVVGLNLSIPLFTSGSRLAKIKQGKLAHLKAQNNQRMVSEELEKASLQTSIDLSTSKEKYTNSLKNKELANRIYELSLVKFKNGIISSTELSQIETQSVEAEIKYVESALNLLNAYTARQKVMNQL